MSSELKKPSSSNASLVLLSSLKYSFSVVFGTSGLTKSSPLASSGGVMSPVGSQKGLTTSSVSSGFLSSVFHWKSGRSGPVVLRIFPEYHTHLG